MKQIYIIEHLEPKLWEWCLIEYEHISQLVGKSNLWFTNIKNAKEKTKLKKFGKVFSDNVSELNLNDVCVLDPEAKKTLSPKESSKFKYFIFGGILGDYPPKKRTKKELTRFIKNPNSRNIGKAQMSTDNAVYTVYRIAKKQRKFSSLKFQEGASININKFESVDLPYRYNLINGKKGKPYMSQKIIAYLKKKRGF